MNDTVELGSPQQSEYPQPPSLNPSADELTRLIEYREYIEAFEAFASEVLKKAKEREKTLVREVEESWSLVGKTSEKRGGYTYSLVESVHPSVVGGSVQTVELFKRSGLGDAVVTKEEIHHSRVKSILREMIAETEDGEIDLSAIPSPLRENVRVFREVCINRRKSAKK
jgi:hypothetical protein